MKVVRLEDPKRQLKSPDFYRIYFRKNIETAEKDLADGGKAPKCWRLLLPLDLATGIIEAAFPNISSPEVIEVFGNQNPKSYPNVAEWRKNWILLHQAKIAALCHMALEAKTAQEGIAIGFSLKEIRFQIERAELVIRRNREKGRVRGGKNKANYKGPLKSLIFQLCEMLKADKIKIKTRSVLAILSDDIDLYEEENSSNLEPLRNRLYSPKFPLKIANVEVQNRQKTISLKIDQREFSNVRFKSISNLITAFKNQ